MRYLVLILLNLPVIMLSLLNIVVNHKLHKTSPSNFYKQLFFWVIILLFIVCAFPVYNLITEQPIFMSDELSLFDIAEITVIVTLIYKVSSMGRSIHDNKKTIRDLHQKLSIILSGK